MCWAITIRCIRVNHPDKENTLYDYRGLQWEPIGCRMFDHLSSLFEDCDHHLYDIANEVSWDANEEWGIEGFDLVLNFRLNTLIKSSTHLLEQLRKTVENNKLVITDFISGNGFKYKVRDDEQLITKEKLAAHSLTLEGVHSFVDSIKKRHYTLAMLQGC